MTAALETLPTIRSVVLGLAPSSGLYMKNVPYSDVESLLVRAAELGISEIDTAPLYGCGRSEIDLGRIAKAHPTIAAGIPVATKVGRLLRCATDSEVMSIRATTPWRVESDTCYSRERDTGHLLCVADYSARGIVTAFEESRARIGPMWSIKRLRIHDAESPERLRDLVDNGGVDALCELKKEGRIGSIGLGMNNPVFILDLLRRYPGVFDHVLMAGAFNLIDDTSGVEVLKHCSSHGIEVHIAGVFGAGLLWGGEEYRYEKAQAQHLERRQKLQEVCLRHGVPLPWLAVHFASMPCCVTKVVLGCANAVELDQCIALFRQSFPGSTVKALYTELVLKEGILHVPHDILQPGCLLFD